MTLIFDHHRWLTGRPTSLSTDVRSRPPPTRTWFGASVRGAAHRRKHKPKEDAWKGTSGRFGSLVVVADGLGSRPHSRAGAIAVCRAAHQAVRELAEGDTPEPSRLFERLEAHWHREITPWEPGECSTTVLLSLVHASGSVLLGQVGDGLVAVKTDEKVDVLMPGSARFGNETDALGLIGPPTWHSRWLPSFPAGSRILMATDGVADDLRPSRLGDFITYLVQQFGPLSPLDQHRRLCAELRAWPTLGHFDDKTLAVHWSRKEHLDCS